MAIVLLVTAGFGVISYAGNSEPSGWAKQSIEELKKEGIIRSEVFTNYQDNITRLEFAYLVCALYEVLNGKPIDYDEVRDSDIVFSDTDDYYVKTARKAEIINGTGDGKFSPKALITREQMAVMLIKTLRLSNIDLNIKGAEGLIFADNGQISSWAAESVKISYKYKILTGVGNGGITPKNNATKEQTLVLIHKILKTKTVGFESVVDPVIKVEIPKPVVPAASNKPFTPAKGKGIKATEISLDNTTEYYLDSEYWDVKYLYKKDAKGTAKLLVEEDIVGFIKDKEYLYYVASSYENETFVSTLYRIKTDGAGKQKIADKVGAFTITNGLIYYVNTEDGNKIYKMGLDGKDKTKIIDISAGELVGINDGLVFTTKGEDPEQSIRTVPAGEIYRCDTKGQNLTKITSNKAFDIEILENKVYYSNTSSQFALTANELSANSKAVSLGVKSLDLDIVGEWIYYGSKDDVIKVESAFASASCPTLYKIKLDGKGKKKLTTLPSECIYVTKTKIRFYEYADDGMMNYTIRHTIPIQ